ncbi:HBL/NHE enterotoxin family protein [Chengkuizengella sp. SCS-71B]|uniref:HBL/NHE enterotoxin family protein n=1 Tax=Chengkuizengella sp. SCS-71B TaxID=3115290 RepID=UPI0032C22A2D
MNMFTKKMICFLLAMLVVFSTIGPNLTVSANEQVQVLPDFENLQRGLQDSATNFLVVEAYAMSAQQNTRIVFDKMQEIALNVGVVTDLQVHLSDINTAALHWLDVVKPKMQTVTQDVISWTNTYDAFADPLIETAEANDMENFQYGLNLLKQRAEGYQKNANDIHGLLIDYRNTLSSIVSNLQTDFNTIEAAVDGETGLVAELNREIERLNTRLAEINMQISNIAFATGGAITLGLIGAKVASVFPLVGGGMMIVGLIAFGALTATIIALNAERDKVMDDIAQKTKDLVQTEYEMTIFTNIKDDVVVLHANSDRAKHSTEGLKTYWFDVHEKIGAVIKTIDDGKWDNLFWVVPQLLDTEKAAMQLNDFAKHIQLGYDYAEKNL